MITIIFAPPRFGKTSLMTFLLNETAFDRGRTKCMQQELVQKNLNGFELTIPQHCVSANYDILLKKFRYSNRYNRRINPFRLGFANDKVKTHFNFPYECIGITEAQKYLNSRMSKFYPAWQSRWYEQHGHNSLDIYLDTQRPMLIDVNIRDLAQFIEIRSLKKNTNRFGKIKSLVWTVRKIENSSLFDQYIASGKQNKKLYKEEKIKCNYNIFEHYDSQSCKPKFYDGHFDEDFDYQICALCENTPEGYIKYLEQNDDEMPKGFFTTIGGDKK